MGDGSAPGSYRKSSICPGTYLFGVVALALYKQQPCGTDRGRIFDEVGTNCPCSLRRRRVDGVYPARPGSDRRGRAQAGPALLQLRRAGQLRPGRDHALLARGRGAECPLDAGDLPSRRARRRQLPAAHVARRRCRADPSPGASVAVEEHLGLLQRFRSAGRAGRGAVERPEPGRDRRSLRRHDSHRPAHAVRPDRRSRLFERARARAPARHRLHGLAVQ